MTRLVVDASVVVAALMADRTTRHAILHTDAVLYVPLRILEETARHMPRIAQRAKVPAAVLQAVLDSLSDRFEMVPEALLEPHRAEAERRTRAADAHGDEDYVAVALTLDAPVWTLDDDFTRIEGVRTVTTADVRRLRR